MVRQTFDFNLLKVRSPGLSKRRRTYQCPTLVATRHTLIVIHVNGKRITINVPPAALMLLDGPHEADFLDLPGR